MVSRTGIVRAGKVLVRDGENLVADEAAVWAEAQVQAEEVARHVAADPVHREMALPEPMAKGLLSPSCLGYPSSTEMWYTMVGGNGEHSHQYASRRAPRQTEDRDTRCEFETM